MKFVQTSLTPTIVGYTSSPATQELPLKGKPKTPYFGLFYKLFVLFHSLITPCLTENTLAAVFFSAAEGSQQVMNTCQPSMWLRM